MGFIGNLDCNNRCEFRQTCECGDLPKGCMYPQVQLELELLLLVCGGNMQAPVPGGKAARAASSMALCGIHKASQLYPLRSCQHPPQHSYSLVSLHMHLCLRQHMTSQWSNHGTSFLKACTPNTSASGFWTTYAAAC